MLHLFAAVAAVPSPAPVIGVLALPIDAQCDTMSSSHAHHDAVHNWTATSCFHSLYVKWLEAAGARVAPLPYDLPTDEFDALVGALNGALITGGGTDLSSLSSPYMKAAERLYAHSLALHAQGETWPLWGTCMGMQVLSILGAKDPSVLLSYAYDAEGLQLPLVPTPAAASSRLLCDGCLPAEARTTLLTRNATVNLHHDGVPPEAWRRSTRLAKAFNLLSTNVDAQGKAFASTIEATNGAPVWGGASAPPNALELPSHRCLTDGPARRACSRQCNGTRSGRSSSGEKTPRTTLSITRRTSWLPCMLSRRAL